MVRCKSTLIRISRTRTRRTPWHPAGGLHQPIPFLERCGTARLFRLFSCVDTGLKLRAADSAVHANTALIMYQQVHLHVSNSKMTMIGRTEDDEGLVIMRHSTSRVAFSTVDHADPTLFCYVALIKGSQIALCHIFRAKKPRVGYEMTFSCAQAFDSNYRAWTAANATESESAL